MCNAALHHNSLRIALTHRSLPREQLFAMEMRAEAFIQLSKKPIFACAAPQVGPMDHFRA
jgi:hypothetical protein